MPDPLARQRLIYHLANDWHLELIRLAARIYGDVQREMARKVRNGG